MVATCAVFNCLSTSKNNPERRFFYFPKDEKRCTQWVNLIGRSELLNKGVETLHKYYTVCDLHIAASDRFSKKLKNYAVPTLMLPTSTIETVNSHTVSTQTEYIIADCSSPTTDTAPSTSNALQTPQHLSASSPQTMWKKIFETDLYIAFNQENLNLLELHITDFVNIWVKHLNKNQFIASLKESNNHLEIEETELYNKAVQTLRKPEECNKVVSFIDKDSIQVNIMKSFGFPLRIHLSCNKGTKELFFEKVTYPLLQTTQDLKTSQKELMELLLRKDKEIKEYKEEGGSIALRTLKTPKFIADKHLSEHNSYSTHFGFSNIPPSLLEKVYHVVVKEEPMEAAQDSISNVVKTEPTTLISIKREPSSPSSDSNSSRKKPKKFMNL